MYLSIKYTYNTKYPYYLYNNNMFNRKLSFLTANIREREKKLAVERESERDVNDVKGADGLFVCFTISF